MDYLSLTVVITLHICLLFQLYYFLVVHRKLAIFKISNSQSQINSAISVIVCAKNEVENLKKNLPLLLNQNYPDFELIVVNDRSYDGTESFLRELSQEHSNLKIVTVVYNPKFKQSKKFAVTLGIKAAKNENLIFTDADCYPSSENWLNLMQRNFDDETDIILGYSPYENKGGLLNMFIRYETFLTALNYLSYALRGNPYMGVGRNMAYKKSLFFKGKGFASHMHILSGDDDLFVNQNANSHNTKIEIHPDARMWSIPKKSFSAYFSQKLRHMGAGKAYKGKHKKMLSFQVLSGILFYASLFAFYHLNGPLLIIVSIFSTRLLIQILVYFFALKKLKNLGLIFWVPVFDFLYYVFIIFLSIISLFKKNVEWK